MQITYNETKNGYEVTVTAEEKLFCSAMLERYGFKWSEKKQIYWAPENKQSNMFIQMIGQIKGADTVLSKNQEIQMNIRRFFTRGNYSFADIALVSDATEEEVKLNVLAICSHEEIKKLGLYEKLIDSDKENAVLSCMAMFPETENRAIQYLLKERKILVSESCIAAIRKKHSSATTKSAKKEQETEKDAPASEKKGTQKTDESQKTQAKGPGAASNRPKPEMEQVRVSELKKEYYDEHQNCTSMHVKEAQKAGVFDIPEIAAKAGVKEETVKCKIAELLSVYELEKYGFLSSFITVNDTTQNKVAQYILGLEQMPETWRLKGNISKELGIDISLSCLKTLMKKHDIEEYKPDMVFRVKGKKR